MSGVVGRCLWRGRSGEAGGAGTELAGVFIVAALLLSSLIVAAPDGQPTEIMGLTLTIPEGSKFVDTEDSAGVPVTQVEFPDAVNTIPRVRVSRVEKLGASVVYHSYAQESIVMMEGASYVRRTEEEAWCLRGLPYDLGDGGADAGWLRAAA